MSFCMFINSLVIMATLVTIYVQLVKGNKPTILLLNVFQDKLKLTENHLNRHHIETLILFIQSCFKLTEQYDLTKVPMVSPPPLLLLLLKTLLFN